MDFLNRLTYGVNASSLARLQRLGREGFLRESLVFRGDGALPEPARRQIDALAISHLSLREQMALWRREREQRREAVQAGDGATPRQPNAAPAPGPNLEQEAQERRFIRAIYSENQLQEQLTWFWFNHFNVFQGKGPVRALIPDYEEQAIRPHVLGKFRDLLLATLTHPAMLIYLDNSQNAVGATNENYARELMELHTLGVDGGYSQMDVQELARILTGTGVNLSGEVPLKRHPKRLDRNLFAFSPNRHDHGAKLFLGQRFAEGQDFEEVLTAVELLCRRPATARFISRKLALYFLADEPPTALIDAMASTFRDTDGDIAWTLRTLFDSKEFRQGSFAGRKFKDPFQYLSSALRLLYDGHFIENYRPLAGWLNQLGEPLYGHQTPDGYGMRSQDWANSAQLSKRFELARGMVGGAGRLFVSPEQERQLTGDDVGLNNARRWARAANHPNVPALYEMLAPALSEQTRQALAAEEDFQVWGTLLLSAPEFMYH